MKILTDTHTHTIASTHAYGTVWENLKMAKERGLELVCMTDHGPASPDSPHIWHFGNQHTLPEEIEGVRLIKGVEANIMGIGGEIDIPEDHLKLMEVVIASMHQPCIPPETTEDYTQGWLNVIKNPHITILGHSGNPVYPYQHEIVIAAAKENGKCIEINNHSFTARKGSAENCRRIALCCKKLGAPIVVSTDAHTPFEVGVFDDAAAMLKEIEFPQELIMNLNAERFLHYLEDWNQRRGKVC